MSKETTACPYCGAEEGEDCQSATRCQWADDAHDSSCPGCDDCRPKIGSYRTSPVTQDEMDDCYGH